MQEAAVKRHVLASERVGEPGLRDGPERVRHLVITHWAALLAHQRRRAVARQICDCGDVRVDVDSLQINLCVRVCTFVSAFVYGGACVCVVGGW